MTDGQNATGLFGKLPTHGDFIHRDIPSQFLGVWDQWLQGYIGSSKEQLGEAWLDVYLTSPIWRFVLGVGAVDNHAWAGIMLPSVDRVGRYFPLSLVTRLAGHTNPTEFICTRHNWFQAMEEAAFRALDGELTIDELVEELNDSNPMTKLKYHRAEPVASPSPMVVQMSSNEHSPSVVLPFMLDACLASALSSYSIWCTAGSERIEPCVFVCKGLPPLGGIAAMMDGDWQKWCWQQPYRLAASNHSPKPA